MDSLSADAIIKDVGMAVLLSQPSSKINGHVAALANPANREKKTLHVPLLYSRKCAQETIPAAADDVEGFGLRADSEHSFLTRL